NTYAVISQVGGALYLRVRALNEPNGWLLSVCGAPESQDRLRERAGDHNFVMQRVVAEAMHGPAYARLLALQDSYRWCIFPRQPSEGRDLRMVHSIRNQDLFPDAVVGQRLGFAESQRSLSFLRAADNPQGSNVAVGIEWINRSSGIAQV